MIASTHGIPLADLPGFGKLARDWLGGGGGVADAAAARRDFLAAPDEPAAPAWRDDAWVEGWLADLDADMPDPESRRAAAVNIALLRAGRARVVVTGQQPGFLGGPLYTLYKAAAAVAYAKARTAAGRPTVPLFWFGDDDDDLREAFAPRLYDPRRRTFLKARHPAADPGAMVGAAPAAWGAGAAAWLAERRDRNALADDLGRIWRAGVDGASPDWGRLQRRALMRLLPGSGLIAVSGNDGRLHALAAPLYAEHGGRRTELAALASARGRELVDLGYHAQLADPALEHPVWRVEGGRRRPLDGPGAAACPPEARRAGVALRALVQDWLFRPAAVVVGPGEQAYLEQLRPVHEALGVPRPPLLPRLFARLTTDPERDARASASPEPRQSARRAMTGLVEALAAGLVRTEGWTDARAAELAGEVGAAWERDLARRLSAARGAAPRGEPWEDPPGARQERQLAVGWAAALWGDDLPRACLDAAASAFVAGGAGEWRDMLMTVPPLHESKESA